MTSRVEYVVDSGVARIGLTRAEKRNALDGAMMDALIATLRRFGQDEDARVGVMWGEGPGFCAGGDLTGFPSIDDPERGLRSTRDRGEQVYKSFLRTRKPVIAAVHGACIAGGLELALGAHFIYAAADAFFGFEEIKLGLIPGMGGTVRLPRAIPTRMATELVLSGRRIDAQEALRIGLVNRVLPDQEACVDAAWATAESIASMPVRAVEFAIDVIRAARDENEWAFSLEQTAAAVLFGTTEAQSRLKSLLDRGIGR